MKVTAPIYIMFDNGKCAKALDFYKKVFKATDGFSWKMTMGESPLKDQVSDKAKDHIMHMSLKLADDTELMAMDYNPKFHKRQIGVNTAIMLKPDTKEEADRLFKDLSSNGGSVEDEMAIQLWGSYFGAVTDSFGIQWMIDYELKPKEKEQIEAEVSVAKEDEADFATPPSGNKSQSRIDGVKSPPKPRKVTFEEDAPFNTNNVIASTFSGTRSGKKFRSRTSAFTDLSPIKKLKL